MKKILTLVAASLLTISSMSNAVSVPSDGSYVRGMVGGEGQFYESEYINVYLRGGYLEIRARGSNGNFFCYLDSDDENFEEMRETLSSLQSHAYIYARHDSNGKCSRYSYDVYYSGQL